MLFQGGPSDSLNIFAALRAWLTPHEAVAPQQELFVPGQTQQQVVQQDTQQMTSSQQTATAAALCVLGIKFQVVDTVAGVAKGLPADGVLRQGDVITAVDGKPVTCKASAASLIRARSPGARSPLPSPAPWAAIASSGSSISETAAVQGTPVVGVRVMEQLRFPFTGRIRVGILAARARA